MSSAAPPEALAALAERVGVATAFTDWQGVDRSIGEGGLRAVLEALGHGVGDAPAGVAAGAGAVLRRLEAQERSRALPPTTVLTRGQAGRVRLGQDAVAASDRRGGPRAEVVLEAGGRQDLPVAADDAGSSLQLPATLPLGYHRLELDLGSSQHTAHLVVVPQRVGLPAFLTAPGTQAAGVMTQLYAMRSRGSWGVGDLADLADLGVWAADLGADFVLVNPLHAAEPTAPMEPSPYLPSTRRFVNPVYLRIEDVPEVAYLSAAERRLIEWHGDDARAHNALDAIERDPVWAAKDAALRLLFARPRSARREHRFQAFCAREGEGLLDHALWCALATGHGSDWSTWPKELQDPASDAVALAREELGEEIEYWCWLQWLLDEQLAQVADDVATAGMRVGVLHDLAVGVHPHGADAWSLGAALVRGVRVGAPPDQYNQLGQDWSQPPWHPERLAELGYAPFRDMIRTVLRSAGGLRVDHIMGLFRLWWIPEGHGPDEGTYVHYDHDAMVGVLLLEAERAGAVLIGEDLGTVEPRVRTYLAERGVLGTSILWFEFDGDTPRAAADYRRLCLATVTTHDLPPTAGYLDGVHVDLRHALGLLSRPLAEEQTDVEASTAQVLDAVRREGITWQEGDTRSEVEALHRFLTRTPAALVAVSVSDLAGDRRVINQPGTDEEYPNWRVPLAGPDGVRLPLEDLLRDRAARRLVRVLTRAAGPGLARQGSR